MARVAPNIPSPTDLLCESCGYTLNGLPDDARCPECGQPLRDSLADGREPSAWERAEPRGRMTAFVATTLAVLLRPTRFFRHLRVRGEGNAASRFGWIHAIISSWLLGFTAMGYWLIVTGKRFEGAEGKDLVLMAFGFVLSVGMMMLITTLAARLTHWEASYRGLRLPLATVRKCLDYHTAHYLPVALLFSITTALFLWQRAGGATQVAGFEFSVAYLYLLSVEVVATAIYLFWTYWIAMRNVMFANR